MDKVSYGFLCMILFLLQLLGTANVEKTHGPGSTNEAVKEIIQHVSFVV